MAFGKLAVLLALLTGTQAFQIVLPMALFTQIEELQAPVTTTEILLADLWELTTHRLQQFQTVMQTSSYLVMGDRYSLDSTKRLYYRSRGFGRNEGGGTFTNNYCFSGSRGLDNAGATELSDSQLKTQSSFSGWDFTNTWTMSSTGAVPYGMPIPRATQGQTVSNGTISVTTDGNVTAQAYKDGALVGTVTSTSSGNLQFVQLPMGSYTIVLHRNGQTLSNSSNYLSAADRGLEILNVTISSSSPNASLSSTRYFSSGAGTEGNPYVISTLEEFLNLKSSQAKVKAHSLS